jgi:hypothetical protein
VRQTETTTLFCWSRLDFRSMEFCDEAEHLREQRELSLHPIGEFYRLPTTDYRLPTTDYRLPTTD